MFRYKVSLSRDITVGNALPPLVNVHAFQAPAVPPLPMVPTVEYPLPNFWPPGAALGQNTLTTRIMHQGATLVQDGHDVGAAIPHISIPVFNVLTPLHIIFSKRSTVFFEHSIRFERRFAAACGISGMLPTPMLSCNDPVSLPSAAVVTNVLRRVEFGMSWGSWLASLGIMATVILVDILFKKASAGGLGATPSRLNSPKDVFTHVLGQLGGGSGGTKQALTKAAVNWGLGLGKFAATDGTRTVSTPVPGSPFFSLGRSQSSAGERSFKGGIVGLSKGGSAWADTGERGMDYDNWGTHLEDSKEEENSDDP